MIITDSNNCINTDSITVNRIQSLLSLDPSAIAATCGRADGEATVSVVGGSRPYIYLWDDPNNQTDSTATGLNAGSYLVIVRDTNYCADSIFVTINDSTSANICEACTLTIYNGISPNEDDVNDTWIIDGIGVPGALNVIFACTQNKYKVKIYNRWGDKVWEKDNYDNIEVVWDGNNKNGAPLPDGTYYYVIEIDNPAKQIIWVKKDNNEPYEKPEEQGVHGWVQILR